MDKLGPVQMVALRAMELYPQADSWRRVLMTAKVDVSRVPFDGRAANMTWFGVCDAAHQGKLDALVAVMLEEYPTDPWLVGAYSILMKGVR
jgi:hypothetical protein